MRYGPTARPASVAAPDARPRTRSSGAESAPRACTGGPARAARSRRPWPARGRRTRSHPLPVALCLVRDRCRDRQGRRRIVRTGPREARLERRRLDVVPAARDHQRPHPLPARRRRHGGTPSPSARTATCGRCRRTRRLRSSRRRAGCEPARGLRRRSRSRRRARAICTTSCTGSSVAVSDVMWLQKTTRVRGVTALSRRASVSPRTAGQAGGTTTALAPARLAISRHIAIVDGYSCVGQQDLVARLERDRGRDGVQGLGDAPAQDDRVGIRRADVRRDAAPDHGQAVVERAGEELRPARARAPASARPAPRAPGAGTRRTSRGSGTQRPDPGGTPR